MTFVKKVYHAPTVFRQTFAQSKENQMTKCNYGIMIMYLDKPIIPQQRHIGQFKIGKKSGWWELSMDV